MNDDIIIKCQSCKKTFDVARIKLSQHWGKKVGIKCKHCKHLNRLTINAALMSGKPLFEHELPATDPITEYTLDIKPNDAKYKLATLHVIANEFNFAQVFLLKEGVFIIGRKTDDDYLDNKLRIITKDNKMSRKHCQLTVEKKSDMTFRYVLTDLDSVNGTHLEKNNVRKKLEKNEKIVLQIGDIIGLGYQSQIKLML
jgi:pSer/pThr/pTyr-binding forkhead associated (FHA) protein